MKLDDVYISLPDAKTELEIRRGDPVLREKMNIFWKKDLPDFFRNGPRAILSRGILTPNFETKYFLDLMDLIEIKPICAEFYDDKFCSQNKDKVRLGKLVFFNKKKEKSNNALTKKTVIDFESHENKLFREVRTLNNKSFIALHHNLYMKEYKEMMDSFDLSVFKKEGDTAKDVYEKIFSLCIVDGILFENFIAKENEHEKKFTENVILPAFNSVVKRFNLKPLIVPLLPLKNEEKESWMWYPSHLEQETENILKNEL